MEAYQVEKKRLKDNYQETQHHLQDAVCQQENMGMQTDLEACQAHSHEEPASASDSYKTRDDSPASPIHMYL